MNCDTCTNDGVFFLFGKRMCRDCYDYWLNIWKSTKPDIVPTEKGCITEIFVDRSKQLNLF